MKEGDRLEGHAFISYSHENSHQVDQLERMLRDAGVPVWRDTADLWPGQDWRTEIRRAITSNALVFIVCFSQASLARRKSYLNEELTLAIEQMRQRPPDDPWLIPIRFDECEIPDRDIGGGRTLASIQRADLFGNHFDEGVRRILGTVTRILGRTKTTAEASVQFPLSLPEGIVIAWGNNERGQCSVPSWLDQAVAVAAGGVYSTSHSLALTSYGTVIAWGDNSIGQCNVPEWLNEVTAIAAGAGYSLALTSKGTVAAWGNNLQGQCQVPDDLTGVTAIAAGFDHSLALTRDGKITAWGRNLFKECDVPPSLSRVRVTAVAASRYHSYAVTSDGTITSWGEDSDRSRVIKAPSGLTGVIQVGAGDSYGLALTRDGIVVPWGWHVSNCHFREGSNRGYYAWSYPVPRGLTDVVAIAAGPNHSLALTRNGEVTAWGHNKSGQCNVPSDLIGVSAIAAGPNHSLALVPRQVFSSVRQSRERTADPPGDLHAAVVV